MPCLGGYNSVRQSVLENSNSKILSLLYHGQGLKNFSMKAGEMKPKSSPKKGLGFVVCGFFPTILYSGLEIA